MTGIWERDKQREKERQHFAIAYMPSGKAATAVFDFPSKYEYEEAIKKWRQCGFAVRVFEARNGLPVEGYTPEGTHYTVELKHDDAARDDLSLMITTAMLKPDTVMHVCPSCGTAHPDGRVIGDDEESDEAGEGEEEDETPVEEEQVVDDVTPLEDEEQIVSDRSQNTAT